ncbi:MAG TPA: two-component regulator propeller domain-containing protein [Gemmatimonadaceae bacterium]
MKTSPPHPGVVARASRRLAVTSAALLSLALPLHPIAAQQHRLAFERLGTDQGLSNGTVTSIAQGTHGFLWLGTEDGLDRYDGSGFTVLRPVPGDSGSLADGWVTALLASPGGLWIGTRRGGVQRFIPGSERLRHYRNVPGDPSSLGSDHVLAMHEAPDGSLWVGTPRGLDHLDPASGRVRRYAPATGDSTDAANNVQAIARDASGLLWVGTGRGLFLFDPGRARFARIDTGSHPLVVHALLPGLGGVMWVGADGELLSVDVATRLTRTRYLSETPAHPSPFTGRVTALAAGEGSTIWVGSDDGVASLDQATGTFARHRNDRHDPRALGGSAVRSVLVDRGGVLWVGLEDYGVSKYAPSAVHFDLIHRDPSSPRSLSSDYIRGISEDHAGNLWIATQYGGLNRLDRRTGRVTVFRHRDDDPRSLPGDDVWAFLQDHARVSWVGLHEHGLGTLDPRTGAFTPSALVPPQAGVNQIYETRDGALLVGLNGLGLCEISRDRRRVLRYGATFGDRRVLATNDVQAILEDREGMLWVGGEGGLTRIDRRSGRATRFRAAPGQPGALRGYFITNIVEDRSGTIWVATKGGGLSRFDRRTGTFTTLGVRDGLPHNFVYGILEDARGRLWLSTDDGIAMLDPRTGAITRYGMEDGLQGREFNRRAFYRARDGTMYFGGINGVNVFRPDAVAAPPPPRVSLVGLSVADAPPRLAVRYTADSVVRLRPGRNRFTITFMALDFAEPRKITYAYRLDGVDDRWIIAGRRRDAAYASLAPGRYVFHVRAANADGVWSPSDAAVTFVVEPPWWATWWARTLAVVALVALFAAAMRIRLHAVRRRSALLERQVEEQTRDLREVHAHLAEALARERETARELLDITAAVPGAVFQLREAPDGRRSFPFASEGIIALAGAAASDGGAKADPRHVARELGMRLLPADREAVVRLLAASRDTLEPLTAELRWTPDGDVEVRWLSVRARPSRHPDGSVVWTGVIMDSTAERRAETERAALEAKMLHAQKAESLGILAGGIAHDFNNLLVGVLANADLLRDQLPLTRDTTEMVGSIRAAALRAAELTQQLLAYAGKGRLVVERVDLAELVREMLTLLRSVVPRTIAFDVDAEPGCAVVEADATQLRQVVMNLVTNASEAIGDGGGRLTVRVGAETASLGELALLHAAPDMPSHGPYVVLEVADDGCGMDAAMLGRIFDPFYSTKFTGRGLGLAALLGIVRAHHGGVRVISAPGSGTRFLIYLPPAARDARLPQPDGAASEASVAAPSARVLVVDDEESVRLAVSRMLRRSGCDVIVADDGPAALDAMRAEGPADVILLDLTMPSMDGPSTARALRASGVRAPIILMSGYTEHELASRGVMSDADAFLKKPFVMSELTAVVRELLASERHRDGVAPDPVPE